eukprot:6491434-Amphidinium_carterae.1
MTLPIKLELPEGGGRQASSQGVEVSTFRSYLSAYTSAQRTRAKSHLAFREVSSQKNHWP